MKTSNSRAKQLVNELKAFKGNNTFAEDNHTVYVVYSYGYHFPLYVYDKVLSVWYENTDKYSVTTSKHKSQLRPSVACFLERNTKQLKEFLDSTISRELTSK